MLKIITLFLFLFSYQNILASEYFLTLRNEKVNLRQGPSLNILLNYFIKKFLPVIVQDKYSNFRKIRDHENNTGWVHISQLSKKKAAIIIDDNQLIFSKPSIYSKPSVILKKGKLCKIKKCKKDWCKVDVENFKGWVKKESLWGLL